MEAVVLAAGLSSRMGRNKLLLPFGGHTVLSQVVMKASLFCTRIIVVTGYQSRLIEESIANQKVDFVFNPDYRKGQRTSLLLGIKSTSEDFFVLPGDIPMISDEDIFSTISLLETGSIARCFHNGIPGHPVAFRKENRDRILSYPGQIKDYLEDFGCLRHPGTIGSVFDADTSIRYQALLRGDLDPALL